MMAKQLFLAAVLIASSSISSAANDWYPTECHSLHVCAPVVNIAWVRPEGAGGPLRIVSSMHGAAVVPSNLKALRSEDDRVHVCMQYDPFGTLAVTCLLVPVQLF
jgi:hypothetical protein